MCLAFPNSEYYQRVRLPVQHLVCSDVASFARHTQIAEADLRPNRISRVPDHIVFKACCASTTPPESPETLPKRSPTVVFPERDPVDLRIISLRGSISFTCVTACLSLCLRLPDFVTSARLRLDSWWLVRPSRVEVTSTRYAELDSAHPFWPKGTATFWPVISVCRSYGAHLQEQRHCKARVRDLRLVQRKA